MLVQKIRKEIEIVNIVCTVDLQEKIKIKSFNKFKFLSCNIDLYRCGYVQDDKMIGKVSVFESGKLISIGTKNYAQTCSEMKRVLKLLKKYNLIKSTHSKIQPRIRNMVGKIDVKKPIEIEELSKSLSRCIYEPEQFPALIYRMLNNMVALIFASGKIIITGIKSIDDMNLMFFELKQKNIF